MNTLTEKKLEQKLWHGNDTGLSLIDLPLPLIQYGDKWMLKKADESIHKVLYNQEIKIFSAIFQ